MLEILASIAKDNIILTIIIVIFILQFYAPFFCKSLLNGALFVVKNIFASIRDFTFEVYERNFRPLFDLPMSDETLKIIQNGKSFFSEREIIRSEIIPEGMLNDFLSSIEKELASKGMQYELCNKFKYSLFSLRSIICEADIKAEDGKFSAFAQFILLNRLAQNRIHFSCCFFKIEEYLQKNSPENYGVMQQLNEYFFGKQAYANFDTLYKKYTSIDFKNGLKYSCIMKASEISALNVHRKLYLDVKTNNSLLKY